MSCDKYLIEFRRRADDYICVKNAWKWDMRGEVRAVQWWPALRARARHAAALPPVAPKNAIVGLGVVMLD